jgi:hypothetical protein
MAMAMAAMAATRAAAAISRQISKRQPSKLLPVQKILESDQWPLGRVLFQ